MTKSIRELCESLPASEPELRARADEFNRAVHEAMHRRHNVEGGYFCDGNHDRSEACVYDKRLPSYMDNIADAKAATDAMCGQLRVPFQCEWFEDKWRASFYFSRGLATSFITVFASTEPLARAACALLAAMAMTSGEVNL